MQSSGSSSDPFEDAFLHAYPNPERKGCPGNTVLKGLASKQLPIGHPARMHITQCSPCFREFREFEAQHRRSARVRSYTTIAALFFIVFGLFWAYRHFQPGPDTRLVAERSRQAPPINPI